MSDFQQGPDWWQASDYKWYPPQAQNQFSPAPQYTPYGYAPVGVNPYESRGTTVMVLGILSLVICGLLGPVAWVMGNNIKGEALAAGYDEPGNSKAGRICGMVSSGLLILGVVFLIFAVIVGAASSTR